MTPQVRAELIARAKQLAIPVASHVAASICPERVLRGVCTDEERPALLLALVVVLAEAVDPVRLREVVRAPEDGPGGEPGSAAGRAEFLRMAHAETRRLQEAGQDVPLALRVLDAEYRASVRKPRPRPEGLMAQIKHDEGRRAASRAA